MILHTLVLLGGTRVVLQYQTHSGLLQSGPIGTRLVPTQLYGKVLYNRCGTISVLSLYLYGVSAVPTLHHRFTFMVRRRLVSVCVCVSLCVCMCGPGILPRVCVLGGAWYRMQKERWDTSDCVCVCVCVDLVLDAEGEVGYE